MLFLEIFKGFFFVMSYIIFLLKTDLGCAVYTGADTKVALNSKLTSNKFSTIEK